MTKRTPPKFRRVVTKHNADGKAVVWIDGDATNHKFPSDRISSTLMWSTDATPTLLLANDDEGARILGTTPPLGGSRFTMMELQPGNAGHMHRTDTVDYVICLSGEIDMLLDDNEEVHLKTGDILVQQATNHAWVNRSKDICRICFVLIDAEEPLA
jgi:hypothetical protein